jgi:hypothetical protein
MNDIPSITIRNRHTGIEKQVSEKTAKVIIDTHAFNKDWEIIATPQPIPGEVIRFQAAKLKNEEYPEVLSKETKSQYEAAVKAKENEVKLPERPDVKNEVSKLSVKELYGKIEFLSQEQLDALLKDERSTVRKMAEDEINKRKS